MQLFDLMYDENAVRMMILLYDINCRIDYFLFFALFSCWLMRKISQSLPSNYVSSNPLFLFFKSVIH